MPPPTPPLPVACANCFYWLKVGTSGGKDYGRCRFQPPQLTIRDAPELIGSWYNPMCWQDWFCSNYDTAGPKP